jgi:hypothetical protein
MIGGCSCCGNSGMVARGGAWTMPGPDKGPVWSTVPPVPL